MRPTLVFRLAGRGPSRRAMYVPVPPNAAEFRSEAVVLAEDDREGLGELRRRFATQELVCYPELSAAARDLGLSVVSSAHDAAALRADVAVALHEEREVPAPPALAARRRFLQALSGFLDSDAWDVASTTGVWLSAELQSGPGDAALAALQCSPLSMSFDLRVKRRVRGAHLDLNPCPSFAVDALEQAYGVRLDPRFLSEAQDPELLDRWAVMLCAFSALSQDRPRHQARIECGPRRVTVRARLHH